MRGAPENSPVRLREEGGRLVPSADFFCTENSPRLEWSCYRENGGWLARDSPGVNVAKLPP